VCFCCCAACALDEIDMTVLRIAPSPRTRWRGPRTRQNVVAGVQTCGGAQGPLYRRQTTPLAACSDRSHTPCNREEQRTKREGRGQGPAEMRVHMDASYAYTGLCTRHAVCVWSVLSVLSVLMSSLSCQRESRERARALEREGASERASETLSENHVRRTGTALSLSHTYYIHQRCPPPLRGPGTSL